VEYYKKRQAEAFADVKTRIREGSETGEINRII
jgi:hypothetical protein